MKMPVIFEVLFARWTGSIQHLGSRANLRRRWDWLCQNSQMHIRSSPFHISHRVGRLWTSSSALFPYSCTIPTAADSIEANCRQLHSASITAIKLCFKWKLFLLSKEMLFRCNLHIYFHMMVLVLKLFEQLFQGMQTEHMQWGPLVEIRGSVVVVTNNNPFYCYCWAIALVISGKHSKGFLFSRFVFFSFSIWHACISALDWFCTVVLRYWPWKRGKLLMDRNKEPADCTQNIRSVLGKFIFDRINLNEKVVGYIVATGLMGQELMMKALIKEDILWYLFFFFFEPQNCEWVNETWAT